MSVYIPVSDAKTVPQLGKFFVKVQVETDFVLHFDALVDHCLLQVSVKSHLLELLLKLFNPIEDKAKTRVKVSQNYYSKATYLIWGRARRKVDVDSPHPRIKVPSSV